MPPRVKANEVEKRTTISATHPTWALAMAAAWIRQARRRASSSRAARSHCNTRATRMIT
jgi:hypothetical protein